jgi:GAF domain-containing protein
VPAARTGKTEWANEIPDELLVQSTVDEEHLRIARSLGLKAYTIAPMIARGRVMGTISFVAAERVRTFSEKDVQIAEAIAERAAVALDNARAPHSPSGYLSSQPFAKTSSQRSEPGISLRLKPPLQGGHS